MKKINDDRKESEILSFIKQNYKGNIIAEAKGILTNSKKDLDIYFPDLNFAIDYKNLQSCSEGINGTKRKDHIDKTSECTNLGIRLVQIFEHEWTLKKDLVKLKLLHIMNIENGKKHIYARKCTIKDVNPKVKNEFLNKYHIQGKDMSQYNIGLYDEEDQLMSVMTFVTPRKCLNSSGKDFLELSRFASNTDYIVVGGFSKLLAHFKREIGKGQVIRTFADLRWSDPLENLYETNGFEVVNISEPSYFYHKGFVSLTEKSVFHRFNFTKQRVKKLFEDKKLKSFDINRTEFQNMQDNGYFRIWDCGCLVYELTT